MGGCSPPIVTTNNSDLLTISTRGCRKLPTNYDSKNCVSSNITKAGCNPRKSPDSDINCDQINVTNIGCNSTPNIDSSSDTKCKLKIDSNGTKCIFINNHSKSSDKSVTQIVRSPRQRGPRQKLILTQTVIVI